MDALNAAVNFDVHIALSLLIYKKCFVTDFRKRWLVLAIGLHIGLNELYGLSSLAGEPVFTKLTGIFCGTAVILLVYRLIDGKTILEELKGGSAEDAKQSDSKQKGFPPKASGSQITKINKNESQKSQHNAQKITKKAQFCT